MHAVVIVTVLLTLAACGGGGGGGGGPSAPGQPPAPPRTSAPPDASDNRYAIHPGLAASDAQTLARLPHRRPPAGGRRPGPRAGTPAEGGGPRPPGRRGPARQALRRRGGPGPAGLPVVGRRPVLGPLPAAARLRGPGRSARPRRRSAPACWPPSSSSTPRCPEDARLGVGAPLPDFSLRDTVDSRRQVLRHPTASCQIRSTWSSSPEDRVPRGGTRG